MTWVSAWARCLACGHEHPTVRPLVCDGIASECPRCGQMAEIDNGPRWTGPNPHLPDDYLRAMEKQLP